MKKHNKDQSGETLAEQSEKEYGNRPEKRRKHGLSTAILWLMIVLFVALAFVVAFVSFRMMSNMLLEHYSQKAEEVVAFEATQIDGDRIGKYGETLETDEYYDEVMLKLNCMKESMDELAYLYVFIPYEDHFVYIWDAYREGEDMNYVSVLGDVYEYSDTEYALLVPDVEAERASDQMIFGEDVGFGSSLSAWCPIFNSDNKLVAMVEADYQFENLSDIIMRRIEPIIAVMTLALVVLLVLVLFFLRGRVTKPLSALTDYVNAYQSGVEKRTRFVHDRDDEIQWLGTAFDEMSDRIEQYIVEVTRATAEKERISSELSVATHIQASMLPCIFPAFPDRKELDLYATMTPAKEVGGDFYDFFMVDNDHLAVVMADVSGKGVPAALFMVIAKTLIKDHTAPDKDLGDVFAKVNELLCESNSEGLFVTAFEGVLDLRTGEFRFVNAGHEMPFICKKGEGFKPYPIKAAFVLAGMEGMKYKSGVMNLDVGDKLFQYTDGVTEATNSNNELYGMKRLEEVLTRNAGLTPADLLPAVKADIDAFVGTAPQFDDITMLCFEFKEKTKTE